jgi:DNA-binding Xre family transcriptional regulator
MRGNPLGAAPEHRPISASPPDKPRPETEPPVRVSTSRYAKPKVLMGEVAMPIQKTAASRGGAAEIGKQRESFRAAMLARHLSPTAWARAAGVPAGEVLGFLAGTARSISAQSLEKLARAAACAPEDLLH